MMLVLTRKIGETIIIGDNIQVVVVGVRGNQVRLGFVAPPEVSIQRPEVLARVDPDHYVPAGGRELCVAAGRDVCS